MVAERVSQGHAPANLDAESTISPPSPLRATMQMESFLPGESYLPGFPQNMEAKQAQENFFAMIATGLALGRMLLPVGRQGLRVAWHALDRATGLWKKVETEDEFDLPENIANTMQKVTPNKKVKVNAEGGMAIYSQSPRESSEAAQSPDRVQNLLAEFNGAGAAASSCQFGPKNCNDNPTGAGPRPKADHDPTTTIATTIATIIAMTTDDQIALSKRNSLDDGKHGTTTESDSWVNYNWGNTKVDNARTTEARLKRMEEDNAQLRKELNKYKQQIEARQVVTVAMDVPVAKPVDVKSAMAMIKDGNTIIKPPTITNIALAKRERSPESEESPGSHGGFFNLGQGNGSGPSGNGDNPDDGNGTNTIGRAQDRHEDRGREFILSKSSSIIIQSFSGKSLSSNPYLPFNKYLKRLIYNQGAEGEQLLQILEGVEKYGAFKFDNNKHAELAKSYPTAYEYNRARMSLLLNYTTSLAKGMVEHGVDNGVGAWRRLYHHHIPLVEDQRKIFMQELYALKPVTENEIDNLFNEVERITELYLKASIKEVLVLEEWIIAAVMRNLPKQITKDLAMELKKATSLDDIHNTINVYMHCLEW